MSHVHIKHYFILYTHTPLVLYHLDLRLSRNMLIFVFLQLMTAFTILLFFWTTCFPKKFDSKFLDLRFYNDSNSP